jgi:hypothetical protein
MHIELRLGAKAVSVFAIVFDRSLVVKGLGHFLLTSGRHT